MFCPCMRCCLKSQEQFIMSLISLVEWSAMHRHYNDIHGKENGRLEVIASFSYMERSMGQMTFSSYRSWKHGFEIRLFKGSE